MKSRLISAINAFCKPTTEVLEVKCLRPGVTLPLAATEGSVGFDLQACLGVKNIILEANVVHNIPTGIAVNFTDNYFGVVAIRSGVGAKRHIQLATQIGVIDSDYQGEIHLPLFSPKGGAIVHNLERLAQLVIFDRRKIRLRAVDNFSTETKRGINGFGSTGAFYKKDVKNA